MPPYGCLIFQLTLSFVDAAQIRVCGKNPKRWCSMRYLCMFIWLEYQMPRKLCINSHSTGLFVRFRDTHTRAYWRSCPSYSTARLASRCRGSLAMAIYTRSYWWWLLFGNAACECCLHAFALQPLKVSFPSANCQCGDVINNASGKHTHKCSISVLFYATLEPIAQYTFLRITIFSSLFGSRSALTLDDNDGEPHLANLITIEKKRRGGKIFRFEFKYFINDDSSRRMQTTCQCRIFFLFFFLIRQKK